MQNRRAATTNFIVLDPDGWPLVRQGKDETAIYPSLSAAKRAADKASGSRPGHRYTVYVSAATVEAVVTRKDWKPTAAR